MPPFIAPRPAASGIKEKVDSLTVHADRLYAGTATGSLYIYAINDPANVAEGGELLSLVEVKKGLVRKSIEQLGVIKEINSLVVLSEMTVTLFPLSTFSPPTPLAKAKAAFTFGIHSTIQTTNTGGELDAGFSGARGIPTHLTQLVVGCRRRVVIYSWKDAEAQEVREASSPHSARIITFLNQDTAYMAYTATDYAIFSMSTMTATDISTPLPAATSTGTFSGLAGYMTLGLGAKAKPGVIQISDSEVLIAKENEGIALGLDAKPSRPSNIDWPAPPEELALIKPYILSIFPPGVIPSRPIEAPPAGTTSTAPPPTFIQSTVLQVRSSLSLQLTQSLSYPFMEPTSSPVPTTVLANSPPQSSAIIRLITPSPSSKSPLYFVTTPVDRAAATADGSTIWQLSMKSWAEQIDELVLTEAYADALALLDTLDVSLLPDKDQRTTKVRALLAVSQFKELKFKLAFKTFGELDLNPAKVVALYGENIAGRLSVPQENWVALFGGPVPPSDDSSSTKSKSSEKEKEKVGHARPATELLDGLATAGSIRDRLKTGFGALIPAGGKEDDTSSIVGKPRGGPQSDFHRSIDSLTEYLSDRRPKLGAALEAANITPQYQHQRFVPLSETSLEELFALPNAPLSALTPEQLLRFAQIVDTALYKSYLAVKPGLLGPLCRLPNWCEVTEVEEDLRACQKFAELRDLYKGKNMHGKALELLRQLSDQATDMEEKLMPSIIYLQKLGPEYLNQIFQSSKWLLEQDANMAFNIFTSEDVELPRPAVTDFLEGIDIAICIRYLEYLVDERDEKDPALHDRLAESYLRLTLATKKRGDEQWTETYAKLLQFIGKNDIFGLDRMYGLVSSTELYEARAILLGRLKRHDQALELYVHKLHDYLKAEEYCKRIYKEEPDMQGVFLILLRIFLRPTVQGSNSLLQPALDLISRHGPRLDSAETLSLLPPLVTAQDVKAFLLEAMRAPIFDMQVAKNISKAHRDNTARKLMVLQTRRVKVTDSRICPQCHKRIGNSVIAVHSPRGEVTHYQCREAFSKKLTETLHSF
ncbi:hypothetical protein BDN72DRAFT_933557 [Pluteus cervinus]|uniref:Uncharacterized protein n=1 Tax=Pluteus cervinus TaxID=181527 RepID=A0ACD3A8W3_9AGAR|nr:hypothetical protein BDN72DRAFT_933557 [Pluteus cervinus]